jgi:hypothetical protein
MIEKLRRLRQRAVELYNGDDDDAFLAAKQAYGWATVICAVNHPDELARFLERKE